MPRRSNLIKPYRECAKASNYRDYNNLKHTEKIIMTYVCFDEMSSLFQDKDGEKKKIKDKIVFYAEEIARYGGSLGLCLINSLQRPTRDNMSPLIKSQCTTVISFRQNNSKSSEVAVDDPSLALGLEQREFVYRLASKDIEYGIVPWVKDIELEKIIKPFKKPHRTLFDDLEKLSHRNGIKKNKKNLVETGTHIKTEQEQLKENISKISNYVPYENPTGKIIIDKTQLSPKTDKPIKKGMKKLC
jgi:S-DNA-T family DNA segregation ATPase FtsK/SpoIIIE